MMFSQLTLVKCSRISAITSRIDCNLFVLPAKDSDMPNYFSETEVGHYKIIVFYISCYSLLAKGGLLSQSLELLSPVSKVIESTKFSTMMLTACFYRLLQFYSEIRLGTNDSETICNAMYLYIICNYVCICKYIYMYK